MAKLPHQAHPGMGAQRPGHPAVRQKAPGPTEKQVNYKSASQMGPSAGMVKRTNQSGYTSPMTDSGGGMGNDCAAHHRSIIGK